MFRAGTIYCEDGKILSAVCELDEKENLNFTTDQFERVMKLTEEDLVDIFKKYPSLMAKIILHS